MASHWEAIFVYCIEKYLLLSNNIKLKAIKAFKWNVISQFLNQLIAIGMNVLMVRALSPFDYGLFAVPFVLYTFFRMIQDLGVSELYIKEQDDSVAFYSTVFWFIIISGFFFSLVSYSLGFYISDWTGFKQSTVIQKHLSFALCFGLLFVPIDIYFRKILDFKATFLIELVANLISGLCGLYLAYNDFGWLSLSYKMMVYGATLSLISIVFCKVFPKFLFDKQLLIKHHHFTVPNLLDQILNFLYRNLDTVLIGKYIGTTALGIYDRSYKFLLLPIQQVSTSFSKVMFPAFSNIKNDKEKFARNYLKICQLISLVTFPLMFGLFVLAESIVLVIFGIKWMAMIPLIKIFSLVGAFQSISSISSYIFYLKDEAKLLLKYSLVSKLVIFLFLIISIFYFQDINYVALAVCLSSVILTLPLWYLICQILEIPLKNKLKIIAPQIIAALGMSALIALFYLVLSPMINQEVNLLLSIIFGVLSYWMILVLTKNKAYEEMKSLIIQGSKSTDL